VIIDVSIQRKRSIEKSRKSCSLVHFGQSLASHTAAAFLICLLGSKVDCASRQGPFLQHPASLVERAFQHMLAKVVDEAADMKWR
jgi:hypothetical protein